MTTDKARFEPEVASGRWSLARRLVFCLAATWFFLDNAPSPFDRLPKAGWIGDWVGDAWLALANWFGGAFLGIPPQTFVGNGSGDRLIDWVLLLVTAILTVALASLWTVLDRRRSSYRWLHHWLRAWLRYLLASSLLTYGLMKMLPTQMPSSLARMLEPYGQSSPMGLLWTFLGESPPYEVFAGACETLAGLLLLFRRTTGLGALVGAGVLTNVVLMNFCYDVPVKIYSAKLLLTALFLAAPELPRLASVLVLRRPVAAAAPPPARSRRLRIVFGVVQVAFTSWIVHSAASLAYDGYMSRGAGKEQPTIAGIYDVVELTRDGQPVQLLATAPGNYAMFAIDRLFASTLAADGRFTRHVVTIDEPRQVIKLLRRPDGLESALVWSRGDGDTLTLVGSLEGKPVTLRLKPSDPSRHLLRTRGFHWVNDAPFNR